MSYNDSYVNRTRLGEHHNLYTRQPYSTQPYSSSGGGYHDGQFTPPAGSSGTFQGAGAPAAWQQSSYVADKTAFKTLRYVRQENLWTKGGRGRCIGRFFCCGIMVFAFLFISILLTSALWIAPPNVIIHGINLPTSWNATTVIDGSANLGVNISVHNPNIIDVTFQSLAADLKYKLDGNSTHFANGTTNNLVFKSHTTTWFTFPFTIDYELANDPQAKVLLNLATQCGIICNTTSGKLPVDYTIKATVQALSFTFSPTFSSTNNFTCPSQIKKAVTSFANQNGLSSILGILGDACSS